MMRAQPPARAALARHALIALAAFTCIALHWGTLRGHFLSDDFGAIWNITEAWAHGTVPEFVLAAFTQGQGQPGGFYRPIGVVSWAINVAFAGGEPWGWRVFNLLLHLANGWLVLRLVRRLGGDQQHAAVAAAIAAVLFWLYPLAPEVSAWVVARYDGLALAFLLIAIERHAASTRWFDRACAASLVALLLALGSKESAMTAPAFLFLAGIARANPDPRAFARGVVSALRDIVPALVLLGAYLGWRALRFGSALSVYTGTSPLEHLAPLTLWRHLLAMAPVVEQPLAWLWPWIAIAIALALVLGAARAWCAGAWLRLWAIPAAGFVIAVGAVLPYFAGVPANGEGARVFYLAGAWLAVWIALPFAAPARSVRVRSLEVGVLGVLVVLFAAGLGRSLVPWRQAGDAMHALMMAVAAEAPRLRAQGAHALVIAPDHLRTVPFLRNAQGAPVARTFQQEDLADAITMFTDARYAQWAGRLVSGDILWPHGMPLRFHCFDADAPALVALAIDAPPEDAAAWEAAWRGAIARSACADEFARSHTITHPITDPPR